MARRTLNLRTKRPLPRNTIAINVTKRDRAKWASPFVCYLSDPWDDTEIWNDTCIWRDNGAELVTDLGVPVLDAGEIVLDL